MTRRSSRPTDDDIVRAFLTETRMTPTQAAIKLLGRKRTCSDTNYVVGAVIRLARQGRLERTEGVYFRGLQ